MQIFFFLLFLINKKSYKILCSLSCASGMMCFMENEKTAVTNFWFKNVFIFFDTRHLAKYIIKSTYFVFQSRNYFSLTQFMRLSPQFCSSFHPKLKDRKKLFLVLEVFSIFDYTFVYQCKAIEKRPISFCHKIIEFHFWFRFSHWIGSFHFFSLGIAPVMTIKHVKDLLKSITELHRLFQM